MRHPRARMAPSLIRSGWFNFRTQQNEMICLRRSDFHISKIRRRNLNCMPEPRFLSVEVPAPRLDVRPGPALPSSAVTTTIDKRSPSTLGGRLLDSFEFLQVLFELRLPPRNVPRVDHENDPDQSVSREEVVVSHTAP